MDLGNNYLGNMREKKTWEDQRPEDLRNLVLASHQRALQQVGCNWEGELGRAAALSGMARQQMDEMAGLASNDGAASVRKGLEDCWLIRWLGA